MREFAPALFIKMFGDPLDNPHGWQVSKLGDVIQGFQGGKSVRTGNGRSQFRILKVSAVTDGIFNPLRSKPVPADYVPRQNHFVRAGDLLISRSNTSDLVGATAIVERAAPNVVLPDLIWKFVWRTDSSIEPAYLDSFLKTASMRAALSAMATGTSGSMKKLSQAKLKSLPVLLPPLSLQRRYTAIVESVRTVRCSSESATGTVAAITGTLMFRLLGGEASKSAGAHL